MAKYRIRSRTKKVAKQAGLVVKPSSKKYKKLDVFCPDGKTYIRSVGDKRYKDFHIYKELEKEGKVPKGTAQNRQRNFRKRFAKSIKKPCSGGALANLLLWT